ncbi:MAG: Anthranilate synthase component 1 [Haliscomenobacter sp.]|jgi:anthranilate synthase component 1|nr:Anthranilate synthase component 1 [Haliscomenobacter sp.]
MEINTLPQIRIQTRVKKYLADLLTPVSLFLRVRDQYTNPVLLESNDFSSAEDCFSFIGLQGIAHFEVNGGKIVISHPDGSRTEQQVSDGHSVPVALKAFADSFSVQQDTPFPVFNGFFGHVGFDGVQYFDSLSFDPEKRKMDIPDIRFTLHRFIIAINHFKNELYLLENLLDGESSEMEKFEGLLRSQKVPIHEFHLEGEESSNLTDAEFMELVRTGKYHCQIGDVFQIVFSRQFSQQFKGDEFNVYRVLRSINPSPYLFYFDYGSFKILGSSPEAQMLIREGVARVNPIAGTYRRTGNNEVDAIKARELAEDPKEVAEHIMLVDLARNDLGRHATNVRVKKLKEIQFFSHVIHLVSTVEGDLEPGANPIQIFGDTFPAGTLSGAPKYKAIELINQYENQNRGFYGGSIGMLGFNGDITQAIVIRSFLSKDNTLFYQAGAGIVAASQEESELQEVNNKLGALKRALKEAEGI